MGVSIPLFAFARWTEGPNVETGQRGGVGPLTITSASLFGVGLVSALGAIAFKPSVTTRHVEAALAPTPHGAVAALSWTF